VGEDALVGADEVGAVQSAMDTYGGGGSGVPGRIGSTAPVFA